MFPVDFLPALLNYSDQRSFLGVFNFYKVKDTKVIMASFIYRVNSPVKPRRAPSPGKTRSGPRDGRARGRSPKGGGGGQARPGQKDSGQQDPLMDDNQVMTNEEEERAHAYLSKVRRRMSRSLSPGT